VVGTYQQPLLHFLLFDALRLDLTLGRLESDSPAKFIKKYIVSHLTIGSHHKMLLGFAT